MGFPILVRRHLYIVLNLGPDFFQSASMSHFIIRQQRTGWIFCHFICGLGCCSRDWSRLGASYANNMRVIYCPAQKYSQSAARGPLENTLRGCCCGNALSGRLHWTMNNIGVVAVTHSQQWSLPIIASTNNSYQIYIWLNTFKTSINRATLPSCLNFAVTHLSLTMGVVVLHITSLWPREQEENYQADA